jgi:hypothetical protein
MLGDLRVHVFLKLGHLADHILDNLRWELFEYLVFGATKDKGRYALLQAFEGSQKGLSLLEFF